MSVKYAKFDSFLKRLLQNKEYKEVKSYEPCVVVYSKDKHNFRFTFLTNERIYVTENPPKTLLYSVHLKDVVDVCVINDKANFLQAGIRDHVLHVVVKHLCAEIDDDAINREYSKYSTDAASTQHLQRPVTADIDGAGPSSTNQASPPILCSYAELGTIENSRTPFSPGPNSFDQDTPSSTSLWSMIKSAKSWKTKSREKLEETKSHWEHVDPYPIHVLSLENDNGSPMTVDELHLYFLDENTTFLPLLKSVWRNYIISSTQFFENEKLSPEKSAAMDESTRSLFYDLKRELLFVKNVERQYSLYHEMHTAAIHDILIKRLFWKDDLLFKRSINLISRYLNKSVCANVDERTDEIELGILILKTVALMLSEVEGVPQCYRVLQNLGVQVIRDFINSLLSPPELLCSSWSYHDDIKAFLIDCTIAVCEVLYQLIVASKQIAWIVNGKSPGFNSAVLFCTVDENTNLSSFLDRLISASITVWDPPDKRSSKLKKHNPTSRVEPFNFEESLKAFYLFTVLHRLIAKCTNAAQYVKSNFQEEFKYYINPGSVSVKFPSAYPISGMARSAVHAVGSFITGGISHSY